VTAFSLSFLKYFQNTLLRYSQQPRDGDMNEFYQDVTEKKIFHQNLVKSFLKKIIFFY